MKKFVLSQELSKEKIVIRVEFLGPIQKEPLELEIKNLNELATILQSDEELSQWLENSAVAVNDALVSSLEYELKEGDKVSLLPPVCGG
jgi:molybdopterin synthase sulfur carrier subunit